MWELFKIGVTAALVGKSCAIVVIYKLDFHYLCIKSRYIAS